LRMLASPVESAAVHRVQIFQYGIFK
jgi:hypothetical protein